LFADDGHVPIIIYADLYDAAPVEYGVSNRLEPLHLIQRLQYSRVFHIYQAEGRDVNRVVLEILQVECLYVLQHQKACSLGTQRPLSEFIAVIRRIHGIILHIFHTLHKIYTYIFNPGIKCTDFDEIRF
jgi:hypothetical protein